MLKYTFFISLFLISSCKDDKPYQEFETKLTNQICDCISLGKIGTTANQSNFLEKYEDCTNKTTDILKNGLDQYPEDPRISKEEYLKKLPELIQATASGNKCW